MRLINCVVVALARLSCFDSAVAVVVLPSSSLASGPSFVLPVPFSVLFLALVPFFQSHFFL